ncbi:4Fe-4S binding protein [Candidatus Mcinerneyibacteriota bacterium]|nr:4Fe-4S binding protein [Candidatus Mcinerneyibacteriota bacterium]
MAVRIDYGRCISCGGCVALCPRGALQMKSFHLTLVSERCNDCRFCVNACPVGALWPGIPDYGEDYETF